MDFPPVISALSRLLPLLRGSAVGALYTDLHTRWIRVRSLSLPAWAVVTVCALSPTFLPFHLSTLPVVDPSVLAPYPLPSYRGTWLRKKRLALGPYLWPLPRVLGVGLGSLPFQIDGFVLHPPSRQLISRQPGGWLVFISQNVVIN